MKTVEQETSKNILGPLLNNVTAVIQQVDYSTWNSDELNIIAIKFQKIANEFLKRYSIQKQNEENLIVDHLCFDIWTQIFKKIPLQDISFWLPLRTVCKRWNEVILLFDEIIIKTQRKLCDTIFLKFPRLHSLKLDINNVTKVKDFSLLDDLQYEIFSLFIDYFE